MNLVRITGILLHLAITGVAYILLKGWISSENVIYYILVMVNLTILGMTKNIFFKSGEV